MTHPCVGHYSAVTNTGIPLLRVHQWPQLEYRVRLGVCKFTFSCEVCLYTQPTLLMYVPPAPPPPPPKNHCGPCKMITGAPPDLPRPPQAHRV
jgi:hypothetical protein